MINELMIINQAGIALFYHNLINNEQLNDQQSLAGYFDIICRFTKNSFKENLKTLILDSFLFFFYTHNSNYHLVLKCENIDFDKKVLENVSETIISSFVNEYKDILNNFNGEISCFKSFSKQIIKILNKEFKDFTKTSYLEH
ncbi:MAG: hypothetical protein ACFE9J_01805 [Candidatus Hermodarchaeota archaeon]